MPDGIERVIRIELPGVENDDIHWRLGKVCVCVCFFCSFLFMGSWFLCVFFFVVGFLFFVFLFFWCSCCLCFCFFGGLTFFVAFFLCGKWEFIDWRLGLVDLLV